MRLGILAMVICVYVCVVVEGIEYDIYLDKLLEFYLVCMKVLN